MSYIIPVIYVTASALLVLNTSSVEYSNKGPIIAGSVIPSSAAACALNTFPLKENNCPWNCNSVKCCTFKLFAVTSALTEVTVRVSSLNSNYWFCKWIS